MSKELRAYLDELKTLRYMHRKRAKHADKMYTREIKSVMTRLCKDKTKTKCDDNMTKPAYKALKPTGKPQPIASPLEVLPASQKPRGSSASRPLRT